MPRICTICRHDRHQEINQSLLSGEAYRTVAKRFGTSPAAVFRHGRDHIPAAMAQAQAVAAEVQAGTLFDRLRSLNRATQEILREARESKNHVVALQAIGRAEKQLELEARLLGELDGTTRIAIGIQLPALDDESGPPRSVDEMLAEREILREAERKLSKLRGGEVRQCASELELEAGPS